jgi:hypothetical protein
MIDILKHEQGKYEQIWDLPAYSDNSPGSKYADMFMQITGAQPKDSVIDLGCGAGAGGRALVEHKLLVTYLDFVQVPDVPEPFIQQSLWEPISAGTWKYGFCCWKLAMEFSSRSPSLQTTSGALLVSHCILTSSPSCGGEIA